MSTQRSTQTKDSNRERSNRYKHWRRAEFDANTGALKATGGGGGDLSEYAKTTYVDAQDDKLSVRITAIEDDYKANELEEVSNQANQNKDNIAANTAAISNNADAINANETLINGKASKNELSTATAALPYRLETDKVVREADLPAKRAADGQVLPAYAGGEIQLVDNLGMFYNIRFSGVNGVTTSSDQQGIIVDGTGLVPRNLLTLPELP